MLNQTGPPKQSATPAIYRTTITHSRLATVRHTFQYRSYSWYVDVEELPRLPWWLRAFARFHAADHFAGPERGSLRERLGDVFAEHDLPEPDGQVTALLSARVLGYVFNPLSVFWCHDHTGSLRHVIAEVHNTYGERHAYLLPPADLPVTTTKSFYVSPFFAVDGHYRVRAPRPGAEVDITVALHRAPAPEPPEFTATLHGERRAASAGQVAIMQIISPLAPLLVALRIRIQGIKLWLRRVPVVPR